jgi:hypothetical protein
VKSKVSVGALRKVVVRADGSGLGSDWLLDSVVVSGGDLSHSVLFAGPVKICESQLSVTLVPLSSSVSDSSIPLYHDVSILSHQSFPDAVSASVSTFQSVFFCSEGLDSCFDVSGSHSLLEIISSLSTAIQALNLAAEMLKSQIASARAVVDSQFRNESFSKSPAIQSAFSALCFKEKSLSQQLSAILSERAVLRERHVRLSKAHLESTRTVAGSLKRSTKSLTLSPSKPNALHSPHFQNVSAASPPPTYQRALTEAIDPAITPAKPRLFQATTLSINQRNLVPYLLEALKYGNLEQKHRAMEIVISLSDSRSNQIFLVDFGIAQAISQLGAKAFSPMTVKALVALLQSNPNAVQTARAQGVAESVSSIICSLSSEQLALLPEIAELNSILG